MILADTFQPGTFGDALRFIGDNPHFLATKALEQLELSAAALALAMIVVLPIGIVLGHFHRASFLAIGASTFARALPILVLIAFLLPLFGIGFRNNAVALAVLASGPLLTNAYEGVDGVDRDAVDAARGMGMSGLGVLRRIELPLALPLLFAGIRISAVTVVATAPIAAVAGGGGLGDVIVNQASYHLAGVLGASLCVMALSAGAFLLVVGVERAVTPAGVRRTRVLGDVPPGKELQ